MAANIGRNLKIKRADAVIAGVRSKTVAINGEPVDITSDDSDGWRELLSDPSVMSVDLSVEGVTKDGELRAAIMAGTDLLLSDITVEYPNGDEMSGDFYLASVEETGAYNDAVTFTASLQSSGVIEFDPATT